MKTRKVIVLLLTIVLLMSIVSSPVLAETYGGGVLLKGTYIEVGVNSAGFYGTSAPTGYHNNAGALGFVADYQKDGWSSGTPNYGGDYFVPGTPYEGFGVAWTVGSQKVFSNSGGGSVQIPALSLTETSSGSTLSAVWVGEVSSGSEKLKVIQTSSFGVNDLYFVMNVQLINTGTITLNSVKYERGVDPDNEQPWTSSFSTINNVAYQPGVAGNTDKALVTATGTTYTAMLLGLGTIDTRAKVTAQTAGFSINPDEVLNSPVSSTTSDSAIGLAYDFGSLAPGQSVSFDLAYILSVGDLTTALGSLAAVTITSPTGTISGTEVPFRVTTNDIAHTSNVNFYINGVLIGSDTSPSGDTFETVFNSTGYPNGTINVRAVATISGTLYEKTSTVTVDNSGPAISFTEPLAGAEVSGDNIPVSISYDSLNPPTSVVFYRESGGNTVSLGTDTSAPFGTTFNTSDLPLGASIVIRAVATNSVGATSNITVGVTKASTVAPSSFSASNPPDGTYGVSYTYTFIANGLPAPTYSLISGTLPNGLSLDSTTGIISGTPTVPGTYNGLVIRASNSVGSIDTATFDIVINKAITTLILESSTNPTVYGQSTTITAHITSSSGVPTGNVSFFDNGMLLTTTALSGGDASFSSSAFSVDTHNITASYPGSTNYQSSTSSPLSQVVNKSNALTTISSDDPDASVFGQDYTVNFNVTAVTPGAGMPGGTVIISDGENSCDPVTLEDGMGSCDLPSTLAGAKTLTATYSGDDNFNGSNGNEEHIVAKADTEISLATPYNPAVFGAPIQITATVIAELLSPTTPVGQVQFMINGSNYGAPVDLVEGVAVSDLLPEPLGTYTITAEYLGTVNYNSSSAVGFDQVVEKAPTTTVVTSALNPSIYGQSVTFIATVSANDPSTAIPDGTIQFVVDGVNYGAVVPLNGSGIASRTVPFTALWPDIHNVTAIYSGAANFLGSNNTTSPLVQTVNKANPLITITPADDPIVSGQPTSLEIRATGNPTFIGIPTGTVTLLLDGNVYAGPLTLAVDGTVTINNFSATSGTHQFTVQYSGDDYFDDTSFEITDPLTINKADTTTTFSGFDAATLVVGQPTLVSVNVAAVAPGVGIPTGEVEISNGADSCTVELDSGAGSCLLTPTAPGNPVLTAEYFGDTSFTGSTAEALTGPVVIKADTSIGSLILDPTVLTLGQSTTITVMVDVDDPGNGVPGGTVLVSNGMESCLIILDAGSGSCVLTPSMPGQPLLQLSYSGDSNFYEVQESFAGPLVNKASSATAISSVDTESVYGQPVHFSAVVSNDLDGYGFASGTVQFYLDGAAFGDPVLLEEGIAASIQIADLDLGAHSVRVEYSGDSNFFGSISETITQTVIPADTTTTLISTRNPAPYGESVLVIATVVANDPSLATATGYVQFKVNGVNYGAPIALDASGQAEKILPYTALWVGTHEITTEFLGSPRFNSSNNNSDPLMQVIGKADTEINVIASAQPSVFGQAVTFELIVEPLTANFLIPSGTVEISIDGVALGSTLTLDDNGTTTSISISSLSVGYHDIAVSYSGDEQYATKDVDFSDGHEVIKADSTTAIVGFDNGALVLGLPMTVSVSVQDVAPGAGTPGGTVSVSDGTNSCDITLVSGSGSCDLPTTLPGIRTLTASYEGDGNFNPSSDSEEMSVINADTVTTISDSPDPSVFAQDYTVSVTVTTVTPDIGTPEGTVAISDDLDNTCNITLVSGTGSCDLPSTSVGTRTLTATYAGDADFNGSNDTEEHQVNKADSLTTITSDEPDASVFGQDYTVDFSVTAVAPGAGMPGGTVIVSDGVNTCDPVTLVDGMGSCDLPSTSVGAKTLTATYIGDDNFNGSNDTEEHLVNKSDSVTTISSDEPDASVFGQDYTVDFSVAAVAPGAGTPSGTVIISDGVNECDPVTLVDGMGSCDLPSTSVGAKTLTATYIGDANFNGSNDTEEHLVNKSDSVTTISSDEPNASVFGQDYTVDFSVAAVVPGAGTPSGAVIVSDGVNTCDPVTLVDGMGSCDLPSTSVGAKTLTATYIGDDNFNGSNDTEEHQVNQADSMTTITSDEPDASVFGQDYTVDFSVVAVAPGAGTPSGTVIISDGVNECDPVTLVDGSGSCDLPSTSVGAKTLTVTYSGDVNFNGSNDNEEHTVAKADTEISLSTPYNPAVYGAPIQITATVIAEPLSPTTPVGQVQFMVNGSNYGDPVDLAGGVAVSDLLPETLGMYTITAEYLGTTNYNSSSAVGFDQVIEKAPTSTVVTSALNPSIYGQSVTFTAQVSSNLPSLATPNGTVQFVVDGVNYGSIAALNGSGIASRTIPFTALWPDIHDVTAVYSETDNFLGSNNNASPLVQTVYKASPVITVTPSENPIVTGQPISLLIKAAGDPTYIGIPTGTVTVLLDGLAYAGPLTLAADGTVTIDNFTTIGGSHEFTVQYSGDDYFENTVVVFTDPVTVNKADTLTTIIGFDPTELVVGQATLVSVNVETVLPGAGNADGQVEISNGTDTCTAELVSGAASCLLTPTEIGNPDLSAEYFGSDGFNGSISELKAGPIVSKPGTSITSLTFDPTVVVVGQPVTITVVVAVDDPGSGVPTGEVTISNDVDSCIVTLEGGSASCVITPSAPGQPEINAVYDGDANFNGSSSSVSGPVVNLADTSIINFTFDPLSVVVGQATTVSVEVEINEPGSGIATGEVTISNGTDSCVVTLTSGAGTCILTPTAPGTPDLSADYSGDSNFNPGATTTAGPEVSKADTSISGIDFDPSILFVGQPTTVNVVVSVDEPGSGVAGGEVTISNGVDQCIISLVDGSGSCVFTPTIFGTPLLTADYAGDLNFNASSLEVAGPQVSPAYTTISTFTYDPASLVVGQATTVSIVVSVNAPGSGSADGEVVISNGLDQCFVTLVDGAGTCEFVPSTPGEPLLTAIYAGSENYNGYYLEIPGPSVVKADSSIESLTFDPQSPVVGQPATLSVTVVADLPGSGVPSGTVQISNGTDTCEATLVDGSGTCEFVPTAPGQPDLMATYSGDSNFNDSEGTFGGPDVGKAFVTTLVNSSSITTVYGQSVSFTATVNVDDPGNGTVSGTVQFYLDGAFFGEPIVLTGAAAESMSISDLNPGEHSVYAVYAGDDNFEGNTSESIIQTVVAVGTTLTVESTRNPAPYGESVLVIATVIANDPSTAIPAGAVQFRVNGVDYGAPIPLDASGTAEKVLPYTALWVGTHEITAVFTGSPGFNGSDNFADPLLQVIGSADTDITVLASVNPSRFGEAVSFDIHVAPTTANFVTPSGSVQIAIDGNVLGSELVLDENGDAVSIAIDTLAVGLHTIEITYSGDDQYAPNTATFTDEHEVTKSDTATTIDTISVTDLVVGQTTTVSVSVAAVAPGNGIPDGSVTVSNGIDQCQVTLTNGSGSCSLTLTNAGQLDLVATYAESTSFNGSTSEAAQGPSVIAADSAFVEFTYSPDAVVVGQAITVSVTLNAVAPGVGTPTGAVMISNGTDSCEAILNDSGYGTCDLIPTTAGQSDLEAVYGGDGNFNSATATATPGPSVTAADTIIEISGPETNQSGTAALWIATVIAVEPGSGEVTGSVQFYMDGEAFGDPVVLDEGQAESQIASGLGFGNHEVTAEYLATSEYNSSNSEVINYLVSAFQFYLPIIFR